MWEIENTQQDIDRGRIADPRNCAIAVVLKDEVAYEISVAGFIVIGKDLLQSDVRGSSLDRCLR